MSDPRQTLRVALRKFDPFESAIQKQWASFQQAEGCDLELDLHALDLHPLYESLFEQRGLQRGEWDIALINSDWFAQAYTDQAVLDLAPYLASAPPDDYPHGWTPNLLGLQQFDQAVLGLPYHDGPECLIYRKDLFDSSEEQARYQAQYGVPLRIPQTWQEFRQTARFFQRPAQGLYGTLFAAFPDGHNTVYDFCLQLWTRGGELFDRLGRMNLNTPQAVQALEYYRDLLNDRDAIHPASRQFDSVKSGLAFANGEASMMINWFGFASMAETIAGSQVKGKVDIANLPCDPQGSPVSLSAYWILAVGAGSPHPETAYRFIRHCLSAPMDRLLTLEGGIGCRKSTWQDPEVNRAIPFYHKMARLHSFARELPRRSDWNRLAGVIDRLVLATINTNRPVAGLLAEFQAQAGGGAEPG